MSRQASLKWAALRTATVLLAGLTALVVIAAPASAHGSGGPDGTDFSSRVTGVVASDDGKPAGPTNLPGVTWKILANDALLQVENRGSEELVVEGYSGEPYLRIGPMGVFENENSAAKYLNADRFGGDVPAGLSAGAKPKWVRIADEPIHSWHDHRIHWMSRTLPPQVAASQADTVKVFDWAVPFSAGSQKLLVSGDLRWIRPRPVWPWLFGAIAVTSLPLLGAFAQPAGRDRKRTLLRTAAGILGLVVLIDLVHSVDDVLAVPATFLQNLGASAQSGLFLAIGAVGAVWAWRSGATAWLGLLIGASGIGLGIGVSHVFVLTSSQIATTLSEAFTRTAIAASIAVLVPTAFVAWRVHEPVPGLIVNRPQEE